MTYTIEELKAAFPDEFKDDDAAIWQYTDGWEG